MVKVNVSLNYAGISLSAMLSCLVGYAQGFYGASFCSKKCETNIYFLNRLIMLPDLLNIL